MPRITAQFGPEVRASLEHHRQNPSVSFQSHLATLEAKVADEALSKVRIYLDTRFWIHLRDAFAGKAVKREHDELLELLLKGADDSTLVCPITESIFFELDRQGNTERRLDTVRIIDRLSRGIVLKDSVSRFQCELTDLLANVLGRQSVPIQPARNVWVRPYSFLGTPQVKGWGEAEDLLINKAFLSFAWDRSLEELLTDTPVPEDGSDEEFRETAQRITESNAQNATAMKSFPQVFDQEIGGILQSHEDDIVRVSSSYAGTAFRGISRQQMLSDPEIRKAVVSLVYSIATWRRPHIALPFVRILSGLHAYIRWIKTRPFEFQDFFDIRHATAAIPYCDAFLTEKFLKSACTSSLLRFDKAFDTRIVSRDDEVIPAVQGILNVG